MALVIDEDKCARCRACKDECPNEAIVGAEDAYAIAPALCNKCSEHYDEPLCIEICTNDAIHESKDRLYKKFLNLFG
jgi:ferredoxin